MALNHSPEFKVVIVQIVCVVEIRSETAWALTNITLGNTCQANFMHLRHFFGLNPGHPGVDPFWTLGPPFEQTRLSTTRQCYIPNFMQLSLEKIFKHTLLAIFTWIPWDRIVLNKFDKGPCCISNFKYFSHEVSKKIFECFSMYF